MIKRLSVGLAAAVFASCVPTPTSADLQNQDIVLSHYDTSADFGAYKTFALPTTFPLIDQDAKGDFTVVEVDAPEIVSAVRKELVARGYQEVVQSDGVQPDLAVGMAGLLTTINVYSGYYCDYWSYWYYYYPCYPTYPVYSSYQAKTFVLDIVDVKKAAANVGDAGRNPAAIIWSTWMYGVFSSGNQVERQKVVTGVEEGFAQSPYLKTGGN